MHESALSSGAKIGLRNPTKRSKAFLRLLELVATRHVSISSGLNLMMPSFALLHTALTLNKIASLLRA